MARLRRDGFEAVLAATGTPPSLFWTLTARRNARRSSPVAVRLSCLRPILAARRFQEQGFAPRRPDVRLERGQRIIGSRVVPAVRRDREQLRQRTRPLRRQGFALSRSGGAPSCEPRKADPIPA